jgi:hypothetical protein
MGSFLEESCDVVVFLVEPTVNQARKPSFVYFLQFNIISREFSQFME